MDKSRVLVILDHGHCKSTAGKRSPDGRLREYAYTREITSALSKRLEANGISSWNDHPEEDFVKGYENDSKDLFLRSIRINKKIADMNAKGIRCFMVSVHVDASGNGQWMNATGWSAYTTRGITNSDRLAEKMYDAAESILSPKGKRIRMDRSDGDRDKESDFYILRKTNCPCTLVENFFQDNKDDVDWLLSDDGKNAIVDILYSGIIKYIESL